MAEGLVTPTGLDPDDVEALGDVDKRRLAKWHWSVAGNDDGRPWWGLAIRRLPIETRLELASDFTYAQYWARSEQLKVERDPAYFVEGYGHVQPDEAGGVPIPFELWPMVEAAAERVIGAGSQREVLEAFITERIVVVLKARQLGLTWLALHFAMWLMSWAPDLPRAKVLALSKREDDANKLLRRLRRINQLLPPYLQRAEDRETRGSLSRYKLVARGEAVSMVSTPDTARSEQGDLFLWDEAAFARNRMFSDTWTAALPTLGEHGKAIIISTGNGPEEAPGDGQGFAQLFRQAVEGVDLGHGGMRGIFLPDDVHPDRGEDYRQRERKLYLADTDFEQEHPATVEQALMGKQGDKVYPLDGIAAAAKLGAEFDKLLALGKMPEPTGISDGHIHPGIDWGVFTHLLTVWELEGGGIYVPPGAIASFSEEVSDKTERYMANVKELVQEPHSQGAVLAPLLGQGRYDSAGIEQMRTFRRFIEERQELRSQWQVVMTNSPSRPIRIRTLKVRFNAYKAETMQYLTWLFKRSAKAVAGTGERHGIIAISPTNKELLRQLRGLEYEDDGSGRIVKHDDHGPDALVAGGAPIAAHNRDRLPPKEDEDDEAQAA